MMAPLDLRPARRRVVCDVLPADMPDTDDDWPCGKQRILAPNSSTISGLPIASEAAMWPATHRSRKGMRHSTVQHCSHWSGHTWMVAKSMS